MPRLALTLVIITAVTGLTVLLVPEIGFFRRAPLIVNEAQAINLGLYLDELNKGASTRSFDQRHQAQAVSAEEAKEKCHFGIVIPSSLPGGYRLVRTKLLKSLCCFATQADYRNNGQVFICFNFPLSIPSTLVDAN